MPDDVLPLTTDDLPRIAEEVARKIGRGDSKIEFGTVLGVANIPGTLPTANVRIGDSPAGRTNHATIIFQGAAVVIGSRVAVFWDDPHACYVIGVADTPTFPMGTISLRCSGGCG